jgi:hypothetical protein
MKREHFLHCHLAGFSFYEGVLAFEHLKIGTELSLKPDPENRYDKYAVEVYYKDHKLGFIPRQMNRAIAKLLKAGINCFEARVQWLDGEAHPENQVGLIIYIVGKEAEKKKK